MRIKFVVTVLMAAVCCSVDDAAVASSARTFEASGEDKSAPRSLRSGLDRADAATQDGRFFEQFEFEAESLEIVTITMESAEVDSYLVLADLQTGAILAEDDDSGNGFDASITYELLNGGRYQVTATSSAPQQQGKFKLSLARHPGIVMPSGGSPNERYALLVGVEDYPGTDNDLLGPKFDTQTIRTLLESKFAFRPENTVVLDDQRATRNAVIRGFLEHLGTAGNGGVALFYFSGHGTRLPTNTFLDGPLDPEEDGRDEAIVLGDGGYLLDDELGVMLDRLQADSTLVILDSCNSGTATRRPSGQAKGVSFDQLKATLRQPKPLELQPTPTAREIGSYRKLPSGRQDLFMSASRDDELAWISPGFGASPRPQSVLTYFLAKRLGSSSDSTPFRRLGAGVQADVKSFTRGHFGEEQNPQIQGSAMDQPISSLFLLAR